MSALEAGLVSVLSGIDAPVSPRLQQPALVPSVRYQRIYTTRVNAVDGLNVGPTEAGIQVDCLDQSYTGSKALADSVRDILHGYSGAWGALTAHFVNLQTENDFSEQDGDRVTHWVSQRYQIWTNVD